MTSTKIQIISNIKYTMTKTSYLCRFGISVIGFWKLFVI